MEGNLCNPKSLWDAPEVREQKLCLMRLVSHKDNATAHAHGIFRSIDWREFGILADRLMNESEADLDRETVEWAANDYSI